MQTWLTRANAILCYALVVLAVLTALNVATSYLFTPNPKVDFAITSIQLFQRHPTSQNDILSLTFDLKADLTSLFHWNTKQLFVYISAQYITEKNVVNQMVLWDDVIVKDNLAKKAKLRYRDTRIEYMLVDQGHGLRGTNVTFSFSWDLTPISGLLQITDLGEQTITLPSEYLDKPYLIRRQ